MLHYFGHRIERHIREITAVNLSKNKPPPLKPKASASESSSRGTDLAKVVDGQDSSPSSSIPRMESFRLASQSLEEAIKGWARVSQQCEDAKTDHHQVKIEIENLLKELQEKIKELS